jgi:hypothetical protein
MLCLASLQLTDALKKYEKIKYSTFSSEFFSWAHSQTSPWPVNKQIQPPQPLEDGIKVTFEGMDEEDNLGAILC